MLAAGLAHEIRNPLVAVKTFLDLLPSRLDDREFLGHFRDLSLSELRRVTDLITEMLALGKSSAPERGPVDASKSVEAVVKLMESTARKRNVSVTLQCEPNLTPVLADQDQLKQITLNLILNAIDASPSSGTVKVLVRSGPWSTVCLEVRDDGPGIPREHLDHIFDPFFTTKTTGTGLGLALTHQMVVEHGGEIRVESTPGSGTCFRVTLPTVDSACGIPPDGFLIPRAPGTGGARLGICRGRAESNDLAVPGRGRGRGGAELTGARSVPDRRSTPAGVPRRTSGTAVPDRGGSAPRRFP